MSTSGSQTSTQKPKGKNARATRFLQNREPKVNENIKKAMFIKGHNSNIVTSTVLIDLCSLKKPYSVKYFKKKSNQQKKPFDDISSIEFLASKSDCSLFAHGSHTKKRPHNLVIGRLFDYHLLDMIEFAVSNYRPMEYFKPSKLPMHGTKPCFTVIGSLLSTDVKLAHAVNLFVDFFRGSIVDSVNLAGLEHVISLSAVKENVLSFRSYVIHMKKSGTHVPRVELEEIGPRMDLTIRRTQFAAEALRRTALRRPRVKEAKAKKNVTTTAMKETVGTVHVPKQNLEGFDKRIKKPKALRTASKRKRQEAMESNVEEEDQQSPNKKLKTT